MKNRKEFQELNRMAYPILLHYLLTSLFEILDQAIVGHYSVRGFAVVGIAVSVVYGVTGALGKYSWSWLRTIGLSDYLLERTAKEKNDQGRRDPGIDIQDMENLSVFTGTGIAGKYNLCIYGSGSGGKIRSRRCGCL